jgi:uncharacterized protein YdeI (YjbR/CyaY-like superfamily)
MNSKVDEYLSKVKKWPEELEALRTLILDCGLTEELKWRQPCYTFLNKNIVLIGEFKDYCVLTFFKGTLLEDTKGLLTKPGENTQSARLIKFTNVKEITKLTPVLKAYIFEAIEIEKVGTKVKFKDNKELILPEELQNKFKENPTFKKAFNALTAGRQRAYNLFFTAAKQPKTRETRIEKYVQQIISGKGINDCTCGLSQKMPYCDGSHKQLRH